jgi:hypothetical protein
MAVACMSTSLRYFDTALASIHSRLAAGWSLLIRCIPRTRRSSQGHMRVHWRFFVRFAYLDVRPAVSLTKLYSSPYSLPT